MAVFIVFRCLLHQCLELAFGRIAADVGSSLESRCVTFVGLAGVNVGYL